MFGIGIPELIVVAISTPCHSLGHLGILAELNKAQQLKVRGESVREPIRLTAREPYRPRSSPPCQDIRNSNRADNWRSPPGS